jgi:hypothetical protein
MRKPHLSLIFVAISSLILPSIPVSASASGMSGLFAGLSGGGNSTTAIPGASNTLNALGSQQYAIKTNCPKPPIQVNLNRAIQSADNAVPPPSSMNCLQSALQMMSHLSSLFSMGSIGGLLSSLASQLESGIVNMACTAVDSTVSSLTSNFSYQVQNIEQMPYNDVNGYSSNLQSQMYSSVSNASGGIGNIISSPINNIGNAANSANYGATSSLSNGTGNIIGSATTPITQSLNNTASGSSSSNPFSGFFK